MKIAISINGVLRDYIANLNVACEMNNTSIMDYKFKNPYNPMELMEAMNIKASRTKLLAGGYKEESRIENLLRFFNEYGFTIFADNKGNSYKDVFRDLSMLGSIHDVYLFTNENGIILNFTNKFLLDNSMGESNNYKGILYNLDKDMIKQFDYIITDNPVELKKYIKAKPESVIRLERYYNNTINAEKTGLSLKDINRRYFNINSEEE